MTYFFAVSFYFLFFTSGIVFLSYWLFGLRLPTLEFVGYWVELGLGAERRNSMRPHSDEYSLGSVLLVFDPPLILTCHFPAQRSPSHPKCFAMILDKGNMVLNETIRVHIPPPTSWLLQLPWACSLAIERPFVPRLSCRGLESPELVGPMGPCREERSLCS